VTDAPRVVILADDLIWADRLVRATTSADAAPIRTATLDRFRAELVGAEFAIVDLTARAYDGIEAIGIAHEVGARTLAVGQHDDRELRDRAMAAGADRVYPYQTLFRDGPGKLSDWLTRRRVAP
jgi:hypothetical protein